MKTEHNDSSFILRRISKNSAQVNVMVHEDSTLSEVCEAFEGFLLALGFSFPEGARLGFEYEDDEPVDFPTHNEITFPTCHQ